MRQFLRFVLVGCANTVVGLSVIYISLGLIGLGDVAANMVGYAIGLCVSFMLNRTWTFRYSGSLVRASIKFLVAFGFAYVLNLTTLWALIHGWSVNSYLAQALAIVPYTLSFFVLSKLLVFRPAA